MSKTRKMFNVLSLMVLVVLLTVGTASAITIDFESAPAGPFNSYTEGNVTFSASGGVGQLVTNIACPNGTKCLVDTNSPRLELRADIVGGASSVSVDLGDIDGDPDLLFLEVFNSSNALVGYTDLLIGSSFVGMKTLSVSALDISYAVFGARAPALNGSSVFADNFSYTAVPEPSTLLLVGSALGVLGLVRRKFRS